MSFENEVKRISSKGSFLPILEIKSYNVMIGGQNIFYQSVRNNLITYDSIRKITTGQGDDYTTGCLLDYGYFKNYYKMIVIDLSKQQARNADPTAV